MNCQNVTTPLWLVRVTIYAAFPKIILRGFQLFCIPQDDGSDQRIGAGCLVNQILVSATALFPEPNWCSFFFAIPGCTSFFEQIGFARSDSVHVRQRRVHLPGICGQVIEDRRGAVGPSFGGVQKDGH